MRTPLPWLIRLSALVLATHFAIGSLQAQVEGILEPLTDPCEVQTHRLVDACTGDVQLVWSSAFDLAPYVCQNVQAAGTPSGLTCPGLDLQEIALLPPPCQPEVRGVEAHADSLGTSIEWPRLACSESYDVVYGQIGRPAENACDPLHPCPPDDYCSTFLGDCGGTGYCKPKPIACTLVIIPVCGCDGVTYNNECEAEGYDAPVACDGICPCPTACSAPGGCLDVGPVACKSDDHPAGPYRDAVLFQNSPPPGEAFYVFVRAKGPGVLGVTTYGSTTAGEERIFTGDCPP